MLLCRSALRSFKRRVAYANITYDHIVGWSTSSIRRQHELPKLELEANNEKYPHVIHVDTANSEGSQQEDSVDTSLTDSLEGNIIAIYVLWCFKLGCVLLIKLG
uniref:DUF676 domain-containing protein n=1 Tax=Aegilops tauschii subsp. strangulata TaxID=200361 RepID=A0A453PTZ5_AEGTS